MMTTHMTPDDHETGDEQTIITDIGTEADTATLERPAQPPLYRVLLFNDDYTPMAFVVTILQQIFSMTAEQAVTLMLEVHNQGVAVVGVYEHEIAQTKASQVLRAARKEDHPLECRIEKD